MDCSTTAAGWSPLMAVVGEPDRPHVTVNVRRSVLMAVTWSTCRDCNNE